LASAVAATLCSGATNAIYTVADGPPHSWLDLAAAFGEALGKRPKVVRVPPSLYAAAAEAAELGSKVARRPLLLNRDKVRDMSQRHWVCDNDRIFADLGWQPSVGITEGLRTTVLWYRDHRWL
jgi:nucleoside-diphosphate-sugar epimerase